MKASPWQSLWGWWNCRGHFGSDILQGMPETDIGKGGLGTAWSHPASHQILGRYQRKTLWY